MARLWDWRTGKLACPALAHNDEVFGASFSRDGRWLFSAGRDSTVRIWEQSTGKPMGPALRLPGWCYDVAVSPDGQRIIAPGVMPWLALLRLDDLVQAKGQPISLDALQLLGEILSGQSFHEGGGVVNLSTEEWLQRWQRFHAEHSALRPFAPSILLRGPK